MARKSLGTVPSTSDSTPNISTTQWVKSLLALGISQPRTALISGHTVLPGGYTETNPINFRFDQDIFRFINRRASGVTITASGFSAGEIDVLFSQQASNVNMNGKAEGSYIEVDNTGAAFTNSANTLWWPYVWGHQNLPSALNVKMEIRTTGSAGWQLAFDGASIGAFKIAETTLIGGSITGARWTFTNIPLSNHYLRSLGVIGRNSDAYQTSLYKGGDKVFGNLDMESGYNFRVAGSAVYHPGNKPALTDLSGTLPIGSGGTAGTAVPTAGAVPYGTGTAYAFTAAGTAKQVLQSNAAGAPTWATLDLTYLPDASFKKSVRAATTANITLSGTQTIDGIALVAGNRILVKNQTTASQNGLYDVAAGAWARSAGANTASEIAGAVVNVDSGTQGGTLWKTNFKSTDTLGTTSMNWYTVLDTSTGATITALNLKADLSLGNQAAMEINRDSKAQGLYTYGVINTTTDKPAGIDYGSALNWGRGTGGAAQLLVGWTSGSQNFLAFRSLRDNTDNWWSWKRIYHDGYKQTDSVTPTVGDNTTKIATTAFVQSALGSAIAAVPQTFSAYRSITQSTTVTTPFNVVFDVENADASNIYNHTTGVVTPTQAGRWRFSGMVVVTGSLLGVVVVALFKNGIEVKRVSHLDMTPSYSSGVSFDFEVDANGSSDYFSVAVHRPVGGTTDVAGGSTGSAYAYFEGRCLTPNIVVANIETASPNFTGTPTAPTAAPGTNTNQLATTEFVQAIVNALTPTGTVVSTISPTAPAGWVLAHGGYIGNAASGANVRANADTQALYYLIWMNFSSSHPGLITTSTGVASTKGASAAADFAANKRLILPDMSGRFMRGTGGSATVLGYPQGRTYPGHTHVIPIGWDNIATYFGADAAYSPIYGSGVYLTGRFYQATPANRTVDNARMAVTSNPDYGTSDYYPDNIALNFMVKL